MFTRPRGTRDFGTAEMARRLAFENLLEVRASRHGFKRVQTPIFESLDLFTAKSGPGVVGQLYAFEDKGERKLTLRPELTAPVMRAVAQEMRQEPKPLKLSYFGQCFRYEEFKTGRYREFFQYGVELIGAAGPLADAEIVALAVDMLASSGLVDWELKIGNVGILRDLLTGLGLSVEASEGENEPQIATAMRLLDKGDWQGLTELFANIGVKDGAVDGLKELAGLAGGVETLAAAREILTRFEVGLSSLDELEMMLNSLSLLAVAPPSLSVNLCVARGLDYYTGMVFECHVPELGGEGQVLGGGSYRLMHLFGLDELDPCCGFGLGFDRVLLALEAQAERLGRDEVVPGEASKEPVLAVVPFKIDANEVLPLVKELRDSGMKVELELRSRKLGRSFGWAESIGATHVMVVGPNDLQAGVGALKNLQTGNQVEVPLNAEQIKGHLA